MKGFIEVSYDNGKKRAAIAISSVITIKDTAKGETSITLFETSLGGESVTLRVNHTYDEIMARVSEAV
ncbi:hypothetical protein [Hymenobacter metallicola]|uniref:Uncharacterized protein n=1 Tax=Hymenobacter metallicola TaxID=2563114 RepID=A0A4Z0QF92_9BACT|nr:hypothetical protein [Hymenobacter metallicola]TGE28116.1 hypothetical protein E5K02_01230 [Hymenobacter metallicola]